MIPGFRVLHITDYASAYEGAFIRQLRMLDEEIRRRGGRPSALAVPEIAMQRRWAQSLQADGWILRELPAGVSRPQRRVADRLVEIGRELRPDVAHVHFGTFDLSAARAVRRLRRELGEGAAPQLAWHYRTALETPADERGHVRQIKDRLKFERAGRNVDRFFAVTHALAHEVVARGAPPERTHGIVAGCDTDTFQQDPEARARVRAQLGIGPDDVMVLHMGWKWHRKGGDLLAEAIRSLEARRDGPRVIACSIGAPEDVVLGSVRRLPVRERIHEYHQASDIFLSASRSEGFGNGLVEAMSSERVAVATAAAGQIETFANVEGVSVIPVGDAGAIATAIRGLLDRTDDWARLGASNRQHVLNHHSMRRWARDMTDAYTAMRPDRFGSAGGEEHHTEVA